MKHRIKNFVSLIIAASMLLSLIPLTSAALDDEFAGFETLEEVPFEFELEPGDLPWEELGTATLAASDIPACISPALAEARGHVNRLYQQEPDDYTVMFQNRDGSKTIYVFSYPVKSTGMSMNTTAAIQVNGSAISFASGNIITSRIGVDLFDYNIGYCEVQTFYGGMLTADGVNITDDARGWTRSESSAGNLVYNMSGAAAAEYNMNISATANATLVPGITITPIDPTPSGGITVMAITYSELAGLMSFKSVSNNKYLTLTTSSTPSLTTSASLIVKYSQWIVQFDATFGYILANASNVPNTFIGTTSGQNVLSIGSISELNCVFGLTIVSSGDSTVTIGYDNLALDPLLSIYENNPEDDAFPTACEWRIVNHHSVVLVSGINSTSSTRIEQSGVAFMFGYTFSGQSPTYYDIDLCSASNDQPFTKFYEDDEYWCTINTPGVYSVYYKDSVTGTRSENFTLIIFDIPNFTISNSLAEATYSIQPIDAPTKYLTMNVSADGVTSLEVEEYNITEQPFTGQHGAIYNNSYESWKQLSRSFTIAYSTTLSSKYKISSILTTSQYDVPPRSAISDVSYSGDPYSLTNVTNMSNSLNITHTTVGLTTQSELGTDLTVLNVGGYFLIFSTTTDSNNILNNKALKYVEANNSIVADTFDSSDTGFMWSVKQTGINAPLIRQTQKYICGAATFLQVLYGAGIGEQVASTVNPNKGLHSQISTLAYSRESGKTETILPYYQSQKNDGSWDAGTNQNEFAESINEYSLFVGNASGQYGRYIIRNKQNVLQNGVSNSEIKSKIAFSLSKGWAPFVLTRAGGAPYKYDSGEAHYVCIIGLVEYVDTNNSLQSYVIVSNCHYTDKVLGIYAIPFDEFCDNISELFYYY